uniref:Uncharacterized protein n=1 Tax=Nelumbo nucifera TaxID=4432 RepID=A0A822YJ92_NELNU|nr:TPA_asm: hypothetical protein HUJ06_030916 [Nelumbo nucifera]
MANLQYNFFPTDLLPSVQMRNNGDNAPQQIQGLPQEINFRREGNEIRVGQLRAPVHDNMDGHRLVCEALPASSPYVHGPKILKIRDGSILYQFY